MFPFLFLAQSGLIYTQQLFYTNMTLNVGDKAPDFKVQDENGAIINLSDYQGKNLYSFFTPEITLLLVQKRPVTLGTIFNPSRMVVTKFLE